MGAHCYIAGVPSSNLGLSFFKNRKIIFSYNGRNANNFERKDIMVEMKERFCIVFKVDGLDINGMREELNAFENCHVTDEEDTTIDYTNDSDEDVAEAVHVYFMEGDIFSHIHVKLRYNCFDLRGHPAYGDNGRYVLFPR